MKQHCASFHEGTCKSLIKSKSDFAAAESFVKDSLRQHAEVMKSKSLEGFLLNSKIAEPKVQQLQFLLWLVRNGHPFSIADEEDFHSWLDRFNKGISIPSSRTLLLFMPVLMKTAENVVHKDLETGSFFAITSDGWDDDR
jgi:hypothetical protein